MVYSKAIPMWDSLHLPQVTPHNTYLAYTWVLCLTQSWGYHSLNGPAQGLPSWSSG